MKAWHFANKNSTLNYCDGRKIIVGETHTISTEERGLRLCRWGLHGSKRLIDALQYAPGPMLYRVELGGEIIKGDDKAVATERTYLWGISAEHLLRDFARRCALDVVHLWGAPGVVVKYLKTGDESIRDAALDAARDAAWDAALDAARDAAWDAARDAAWDAARDAAWDAARAAAWGAAWGAAWAAAWAAARDRQNRRATAMVMAEKKRCEI